MAFCGKGIWTLLGSQRSGTSVGTGQFWILMAQRDKVEIVTLKNSSWLSQTAMLANATLIDRGRSEDVPPTQKDGTAIYSPFHSALFLKLVSLKNNSQTHDYIFRRTKPQRCPWPSSSTIVFPSEELYKPRTPTRR